jgi:uncharacterized membrane protein YgcG
MQGWSRPAVLFVLGATALSSAVHCASPPAPPAPRSVGATIAPIIGGVPATEYGEAATLTMHKPGIVGYCSATVIAPRVVLTAGHCVDSFFSWDVYVGTESRAAEGAETFDWNEGGATNVNPNHHDIGLVYLTEPITLPSYPTLATAPVPDGTRVVNVGRIQDGTLTDALYMAPVAVEDATPIGFPFDYTSPVIIQSGDSGGPAFREGTHEIVAVNSGANETLQVLARVDLLTTWIADRVATHPVTSGGSSSSSSSSSSGGSSSSSSSGGSSSSSSSGGSSSSSSSSGAVGPSEVEPNDTQASAQTLLSSISGTLAGPADVDWYAFAAPVGTSQIRLVGDADATFDIGFVADTRCLFALWRQTAARITVRGGETRLCLRASSASHTDQSYTLSAAIE